MGLESWIHVRVLREERSTGRVALVKATRISHPSLIWTRYGRTLHVDRGAPSRRRGVTNATGRVEATPAWASILAGRLLGPPTLVPSTSDDRPAVQPGVLSGVDRLSMPDIGDTNPTRDTTARRAACSVTFDVFLYRVGLVHFPC